jgi:O-glycosyl hydrolase
MRIHVTGRNNDPESATNQEGLMVSAYRNTDNSIVVVVINYSTDEQKIRMNLHRPRITFQPYLTDDVKGNDLKPIRTVQSGSVTSIPPRSVITFVAAQ